MRNSPGQGVTAIHYVDMVTMVQGMVSMVTNSPKAQSEEWRGLAHMK
jgi:hypothetical protein